MAVLCTAIPSSVLELTGRKTVLFTNNLPPSQRLSVITGRRWVNTGWDPVIDIRGREWQQMQNGTHIHYLYIYTRDSVHRCRPVTVYLL
ncbi:unnamed protein product [Staurois parvus]|uniref:Uncharacterized protein n=1 Tax=Staurois parvus TaxID=386267 RepID=A0ABN9AL91_9NEOB|nr:unnamed protein product [Staurois parvus]